MPAETNVTRLGRVRDILTKRPHESLILFTVYFAVSLMLCTPFSCHSERPPIQFLSARWWTPSACHNHPAGLSTPRLPPLSSPHQRCDLDA